MVPRRHTYHPGRVSGIKLLWLAWLVAALAPMWLGPMLVPIERAVAEAQHVCACGMAVGTCGCPECEELERQHRLDEAAPVPVLKGECERSAGVLGAAHLPPVVLPGSVTVLAPTAVARVVAPLPVSLVSLAKSAPPTRPPRVV